MNRTLILCVLMLSIVYVSFGASALIVRPGGNTGTSSDTSIAIKKTVDEGFGATSMVNRFNGTTTSDITRTFNLSTPIAAQRITEDVIASASVATGVLYFYWSGTANQLKMFYRDATGTCRVGSFTFITAP